jgi:hypothetical protein
LTLRNFKDESGCAEVLDKSGARRWYSATDPFSEFRLEQGAVLPRHQYPHEQTGYLIAGRLELTIGDRTHRVEDRDGALPTEPYRPRVKTCLTRRRNDATNGQRLNIDSG